MNSERQGLHILDSRCPDFSDLELLMSNSAFLWGMSAFTTGLISNGEMPFYQDHLRRLVNSARWLWNTDLSSVINELWEHSLLKLDKQQVGPGSWRFRFTLFQDQEKKLHSILSLYPYEQRSDEVISLVLKPSPCSYNRASNPKVGSYLETFRLQASEESTILFYNESKEILETSVANVVFYDGEQKKFIAPFVEGQMLQGIGVTQGLKGLNLEIKKVQIDEVDRFVSAFVINSLRGPQPVVSLEGRALKVDNELISRVSHQFELNKKAGQRNIWAKVNF